MIKNFREQLRTQRWDDHRYYHHSRINQSLHFVSAASFLVAYALLFVDPVAAALIGWLVSMTTRQAGHFFFEPKGYDHVNQATHDHKEEIKVGYNLHRKIVLMAIWALSPLVLFLDPTLFGIFAPWTLAGGFHAPGRQGLAGDRHRRSAVPDRAACSSSATCETGLVWMTKILTDPFSDLRLYYKAPLYLLRGELIDPGLDKQRRARLSNVTPKRAAAGRISAAVLESASPSGSGGGWSCW